MRHPGECDGQSGYGVKKLDTIVEKIIRYQFSKILTASEHELISEQHERATELARARYKMACMRLSEKQKELDDYRGETIRVIRGESKLSIDLLNSLITENSAELERLTEAAEEARQECEACIASAEVEMQEYKKLKNWADLYDNCTFAAKKMIVSQFIKAVYVYRDYSLEIEFNVSFEDFKRLSAECENGPNEQTTLILTA